MKHLNFQRVAESAGYSYNKLRFSRSREAYMAIVITYSKNLYHKLGTTINPKHLRLVLKELNAFQIAHATNIKYIRILKFIADKDLLDITELDRIYKYCRHVLK